MNSPFVEIHAPWDRRWLALLGLGRRTDRLGRQGAVWEATPAELVILEDHRRERRQRLEEERKAKRAMHRSAMARSLARRRDCSRRRRERYARHGHLLRDRHQRVPLDVIEAIHQERRAELVERAERRRLAFVGWLEARDLREPMHRRWRRSS